MQHNHVSQTQEQLGQAARDLAFAAMGFAVKHPNTSHIIRRYTGYDEWLDQLPRPISKPEIIEAKFEDFKRSRPITQDEVEADLWAGFPAWQEPYWLCEDEEVYSRSVGYCMGT